MENWKCEVNDSEKNKLKSYQFSFGWKDWVAVENPCFCCTEIESRVIGTWARTDLYLRIVSKSIQTKPLPRTQWTIKQDNKWTYKTIGEPLLNYVTSSLKRGQRDRLRENESRRGEKYYVEGIELDMEKLNTMKWAQSPKWDEEKNSGLKRRNGQKWEELASWIVCSNRLLFSFIEGYFFSLLKTKYRTSIASI